MIQEGTDWMNDMLKFMYKHYTAWDVPLNTYLMDVFNRDNFPRTDSEGMKKMLNCSDGTLSNYRNNGILPFANHGGKKYYSKKVASDILKAKMIISDKINLN